MLKHMETEEWEGTRSLWGHWRNAEGRWWGSGTVAAQNHRPGMEEWECPKGLAESTDCPRSIRKEAEQNVRTTAASAC